MVSSVSASFSGGTAGVASLGAGVPGRSAPVSGRVIPAEGWESLTDGVSLLVSSGFLESYPSDERCNSWATCLASTALMHEVWVL